MKDVIINKIKAEYIKSFENLEYEQGCSGNWIVELVDESIEKLKSPFAEESFSHKRFWVFLHVDYYPNGGLSDVEKTFDSLEELLKEYPFEQMFDERDIYDSLFDCNLDTKKLFAHDRKLKETAEVQRSLINRIKDILHIENPDPSKIKVQDLFPDGTEIGVEENWKLCSYNSVPVFRFLLFKTKNGLLRIDFKDYGK